MLCLTLHQGSLRESQEVTSGAASLAGQRGGLSHGWTAGQCVSGNMEEL